LLDSIHGTFEILLDSPNKLHALPLIHFVMCCLLTIRELLVMFDMICMDKRLKYLPAHVIHILICNFGSAMTRNTVYKGCRVQKLQVRECIPCMNEYQGRNNG